MMRWIAAALMALNVVMVVCPARDSDADALASRCANGRFEVIAATQSEAREMCGALTEVLNYFLAIGFSVDPSISVIVRAQPIAEAPLPPRMYGYFDVGGGQIVVVRSSETAPWGVKWGPVVAASFLRHEFVHMAVHRILHADHTRLRAEWHEFIAYAVQVALMDRTLRDSILATHTDVDAFDDLTAVNEFTYRMDPDRFAISAYKTYLGQGGPDFVEKLLRFEIVPPSVLYPCCAPGIQVPSTPRTDR